MTVDNVTTSPVQKSAQVPPDRAIVGAPAVGIDGTDVIVTGVASVFVSPGFAPPLVAVTVKVNVSPAGVTTAGTTNVGLTAVVLDNVTTGPESCSHVYVSGNPLRSDEPAAVRVMVSPACVPG